MVILRAPFDLIATATIQDPGGSANPSRAREVPGKLRSLDFIYPGASL